MTPERPSFPLQAHLGFEVEGADGVGRASLELGERHLNPNGVAHGAVPFTLMDTAMGAAVMSLLDDGVSCATIEMQTRFIRAASDGPLLAEARVVHPGRRIMHLEATTVGADGRLVASATASFAVLSG